jgi:mRNA interferase MazF
MEKDYDRWNVHKKALNADSRLLKFHEREIWWCSIGVNVGSEQHSQTLNFSRPVLIVRTFTSTLFWGIPLTTKVKETSSFRFSLLLDGVQNDALIMQMRAFDSRRLQRKMLTLEKEQHAALVSRIRGISSEAEANVYSQYSRCSIIVNIETIALKRPNRIKRGHKSYHFATIAGLV